MGGSLDPKGSQDPKGSWRGQQARSNSSAVESRDICLESVLPDPELQVRPSQQRRLSRVEGLGRPRSIAVMSVVALEADVPAVKSRPCPLPAQCMVFNK